MIASSDLGAIADRPEVDDGLDYESILIEQVLTGGEYLEQKTPFTKIHKIPWGSALQLAPDGSTRVVRYWDPSAIPGPDESLSLTDCAELLAERIDRVLHRITRNLDGVGAHVSGGLDCTAIACRANQILRSDGRGLVAGYSWAPDYTEVPMASADERTIIDDVSQAEGLPIRMISASQSAEWFLRLDPARYPNATLDLEARNLPRAVEDGVGVLLSGWGGDELASFNGERTIRALRGRGSFATAWREVSQRALMLEPAHPTLSRRAELWAKAAHSAAPDSAQHALARLRGRRVVPQETPLAGVLREHLPLAAHLWHDQEETFSRISDPHEYQLALFRAGHLQRRTAWWHQAGQAIGVEYRYPLLDMEIVDAALRLPWWAYRWQGWTRVAFRIAVAPWVPESVAWNLTKDEPTLLDYEESHLPSPLGLETRGRSGDVRYERLQHAARRAWESETKPSHTARVGSRPDLAPRIPRSRRYWPPR